MAGSRARYLAGNTLVFAVANFGTKLISFFLVPLYTYTLSVSDYGVADLVTTVTFVLAPILTLDLSDAVMRFALDKGCDHDKILTVGLAATGFAALAGLLMIPAASMFDSLSQYAGLTYLYCIASAACSMLQAFLRGLERLRAFAASNILCTALTAGLNILFLVVLHWGVFGYLLAYVVAMSLTAVYSALAGGVFGRLRRLSFDRALFAQMARYSVVLIPNTFMWWIINSSDRVVVAAMLGTAANGLLAVAYKLPSIVTVVSTTFTQAWSYSAIREEGSEDRDAFTSKVFNHLVLASGILTAALLALIEPVTRIYVSAEYASAWQYSTWLLLGNYFLTLANFLGASYTVHKDSMGYLLSGTLGAVLNLAIMLPLVPVVGLFGSVSATCASYFAVFAFRMVNTRKYVRITVDRRGLVSMAALLAFLMASPSLLGERYLPASCAAVALAALVNARALASLAKPLLRKLKGRLSRVH